MSTTRAAGNCSVRLRLTSSSEGKQVTFVEWAEFSQDEIPFNHIKINVTYEDDDSRKYSLEAFGDEDLLEGLM